MGLRWGTGTFRLMILACILLIALPQLTLFTQYSGLTWRGAGRQLEPVHPMQSYRKGSGRPQEIESSVEADTERFFQAFGSGAPLFAQYGAYRGGGNTFAVVGLSSKALYTFAQPEFECYWVPLSAVKAQETPTLEQALKIKKGNAYRMLPDMDDGRLYSVVVVNCTFPEPVGTADNERGGQLVLYATHGDGQDKPPVRFVALTEDETAYDPAWFDPPYPYSFAYCSPPLYGDIHPVRIREWLAHHIRLFGPSSHFILHDAGGINADVWPVIEPWWRQGFVSVENVREQEKYDGYYHNQVLINNDCLQRTKWMADWTFFFDVDEYIYVSNSTSFHSLMAHNYAHFSMLQLTQVRMSDYVCQTIQDNNSTDSSSRWAMEDLVYADMDSDYDKIAPKYAVQGRSVFATGVYGSQLDIGHMQGQEGWAWWPEMRYYHYHSILPKSKQKNCYEYTNNFSDAPFTFQNHTLEIDPSMVSMGRLAKEFEATQIGQRSDLD